MKDNVLFSIGFIQGTLQELSKMHPSQKEALKKALKHVEIVKKKLQSN